MSIASVVEWSLARKLVVVLGVVLLSIAGIHAYRTLPVDAVPDVTGVQVQVLTNAPGLSPLETEALVSRPVELAMAGLPARLDARTSHCTLVRGPESERQRPHAALRQAWTDAAHPHADRRPGTDVREFVT